MVDITSTGNTVPGHRLLIFIDKMIVGMPAAQLPNVGYSIMKERIFPVTALVQEALQEPKQIQDFMGRLYQHLNANYVYSFVITKGDVQWT